ncbi:unnamed protein product [Darwinula stevensoni]|uniref:Geminin n=1 Tax=Darwinula stevensoni TaxID=69355 RepID=A0A7R8X6F5_9CRUS|nr:unnamed protein product [Darwinula stevensoni]CAG0888140.1 unnamed protein product [Darwinula stevensoni]
MCPCRVKKWHHKTIQTEALPQEKQQDSSEFITSEEPSLEYWKKLAEERRKALDEALKENEELWEKVHELEKEKAAMELIVNEAKAMAEMLQEVTNEDES